MYLDGKWSLLTPKFDISKLGVIERLEQLRALENGMSIKVIVTSYSSIGIDTPEELVKAEEFLATLNRKGNPS